MKQLLISILALFLLTFGCGDGKKKKSDNPNVELRHNSAIVFKDLDYRDTVNQGDTVIAVYRFINDGYKDLLIKGVKNDGICEITWTKEAVQPVMNGEVKITCIFNHTGMIKQGFMVSHNAPTPDVTLTMRIFVRGGEETNEENGERSSKIKIN